MKRFKLTVAYDGTGYCGWQIQPGVPTIEGELNKALSRLTGEEIQVIGASRTDAGVHAFGNVAVFDSGTPIPGDKLLFALNPRLPEDIRIVDSCQVSDDFHPRYCDTRKTYEYHIQTGRTPLPTRRLYSHWLPHQLDVTAMNEAGQYLVGTHDFKSFCSAQTTVEDTVRTIYDLDIDKEGDLITIRVRGNGFLYNMVRIIAGTLAGVGRGYFEPQDIKAMLAERDRTKAGVTAPPQGLTLVGIEYRTQL